MLNIGILGMGRMGKTHAPLLNNNPNAKVIAAFDPKEEAANNAKEQFGVELCQSANELINRKDIDAIFITSPTYCHTEELLSALKTGKPIFCEKPICRTPEEADTIVDAAAQSASVVTVGFVRRYKPAQKKLQEIVESGQLGTLRAATVDLTLGVYKRLRGDWFADFNLSGGVVLDMLAHHLDLLLWALGDIKSVYANGLLCSDKLPLPADFCSATVTFKNNVICNILASWQRAGRNANMMEFIGDNGVASYKWAEDKVTLALLDQPQQEIECENGGNPYQLEDNAWIDSILNNTKPFVTLEDGIKAYHFADDILTSAEDHCEIAY